MHRSWLFSPTLLSTCTRSQKSSAIGDGFSIRSREDIEQGTDAWHASVSATHGEHVTAAHFHFKGVARNDAPSH